MTQQILDKTAYRFKLLELLYDYVRGSTTIGIKRQDIINHALKNGIPQNEVSSAWQYLLDEGLVGDVRVGQVGITHKGLKEVEKARTQPNTATEHFSTAAIQAVLHIHGPVGGIQTGSNNTMNVAQQINAPAEILQHFAALRTEAQKLPEDKRSTAVELVEAIEEQAAAEHPKLARVKSYAEALGPIMTTMVPVIQAIVEWIASKV